MRNKPLKETVIIMIAIGILLGCSFCSIFLFSIAFNTSTPIPSTNCHLDSLKSRIDTLEQMVKDYQEAETIRIVTKWEYERLKKWIPKSKKEKVIITNR